MPTSNSVTVTLRVREATFEKPLRQRFAMNLPGATLIICVGAVDAFADIDSVSGDCSGPDKPMVKAQEIVGDFNLAMRERNETDGTPR